MRGPESAKYYTIGRRLGRPYGTWGGGVVSFPELKRWANIARPSEAMFRCVSYRH